MTYEEFFRHRQGMGGKLTEQWPDEQIALISQLPCSGLSPCNLFLDNRILNGATLPPSVTF